MQSKDLYYTMLKGISFELPRKCLVGILSESIEAKYLLRFLSARDLDSGIEAFYYLYINDARIESISDYTFLIGLVE